MIDRKEPAGKSPPPDGDITAPLTGIARLAELFERSPIALSVSDAAQPDVPLVVANKAFLDLTGYDHDEVIGRNCRFLQSDLPNEAARSDVRQIISVGGQGQVVFRNRRKDGEDFDNLLFLQALIERGGARRFFLGSQFRLEKGVSESRIDRHIAQIDSAVARAVDVQASLRAEQRRMFANTAYAVANAWLALR